MHLPSAESTPSSNRAGIPNAPWRGPPVLPDSGIVGRRLTIEPGEELIPGRRESRARVVAAGLTDDDIDRLIKQAQRDVEPHPG
jgi:hypothetical protein